MFSSMIYMSFWCYIGCIAWVLYHLVERMREVLNTTQKLTTCVSDLKSDQHELNKRVASLELELKYQRELSDKVLSILEILNEKTESIFYDVDDKYDQLESKVKQHTHSIDIIEADLEKYLDKTFRLTGFREFDGMPIYITNHDQNNVVIVNEEVANFWKSGQSVPFTGEQMFPNQEFSSSCDESSFVEEDRDDESSFMDEKSVGSIS